MGRARARSRRRQRQARLHDGSRIASSTASERSPVPGTLPQTSALRRGISPRFAHEPRPVDRDTPTTILSKPCRQATELPDIFPGHQSAPSARESRFAGQAPSLSAEVFPSATHRLKAGTLLPGHSRFEGTQSRAQGPVPHRFVRGRAREATTTKRFESSEDPETSCRPTGQSTTASVARSQPRGHSRSRRCTTASRRVCSPASSSTGLPAPSLASRPPSRCQFFAPR